MLILFTILLIITFYVIGSLLMGGGSLRHLYIRFSLLFRSVNFKEARDIDNILTRINPFYKTLSVEGKERFIKKCFLFMKTKNFRGMEGMEITDEVIAVISGTAAQLTFGLKKSSFAYYHTIKVFPGTFYSGIYERHLKGGASTGGVLYFSWKDFKEGYADSTDRYNLGLHEMGHALRLELLYGNDFDKRFAAYSVRWEEIAKSEFDSMNEGKTSFLRDYAATNIEEFFAVCVEHFFEVPEGFRKNLPDIYYHLCYLLNLDPQNTTGDYRLPKEFGAMLAKQRALQPTPVNPEKEYRYVTAGWSYNMIVAGMFIGVPAILILTPDINYSMDQIMITGLLVLFFVTNRRKFFYRKGIQSYGHLYSFAIIGLGLNLWATALLMNKYIKVSSETRTYKIVEAYYLRGTENTEVEFVLELNALDNRRNFKTISYRSDEQLQGTYDSLVVNTSVGVFGWENFDSNRVILTNDNQ